MLLTAVVVCSLLLHVSQEHWATPKAISQDLLDYSRTGHFPYSSNSETSVSTPLKEKTIMHNALSKTGDLPLALAVVPFVPLIALVCICIIIALEWRMT